MHLRVTTVRRGDKTYRYAQLVESYRRETDGRPTVRVLASLGALDDVAVNNFRAAIDASRAGRALLSPKAMRAEVPTPTVLSNLRYLDLAVLLRIWDELGLGALLRGALPHSDATADVTKVVAALVLHRCVAPGSKLAAERWYPTTALSHLLAIDPGAFNNSRIHRALSTLEAGETTLQERLPDLIQARVGAYARVFIDATDTWFVGQGPPLAAKGLDKEGVYRRRVGIVLLCDDRGYPLRWKTISGRYHDGTALLQMAKEAAGLPWIQGKTLVLDRAVGNATAVETLAATRARFLTGMPSHEFANSGAPIPWKDLVPLQGLCADPAATPQALAAAAEAAGLTRIRDDRFVLDLGVFDKTPAKSHRPSAAQAAVRLGQYIATASDSGRSMKEIAQTLGRSAHSAFHDRKVCTLLPDLQARTLAGEADGLTVRRLLEIAALPPDEQEEAFRQAVLAHPATSPVRARMRWLTKLFPGRRMRGVLYFNPFSVQKQRLAEAEALTKIRERVENINARLASPKSRRTDAAAVAEVAVLIRRYKLGSVLSARVARGENTRSLVLDEDEEAWVRRRRCYGITVLLGHADLQATADELVTMYFSKDAVEKDFQIIKSALELRPVHHRTDPKVRAHVTLCMLALVLQRALAARLAAADAGVSAAGAIETLATIHLNTLRVAGQEFHTVTAPLPAHQRLLAALSMSDLATDEHIRKTIGSH